MEKKPMTLKETSKVRFVDDVVKDILKTPNGKGLVLLVDDHTAKILDGILKMSELITAGVTTVENIDRVRKPFPSFRAVYFIAPTKSNINKIQEDFDKKPAQYKTQHVITSRGMSDEIFQYLASKPFSKKLETLKEMNIDFQAIGDSVFQVPKSTSLDLQIDMLLSVVACQQQVKSIEVFKMANPIFKDSAYVQKFMDPKLKAMLPYLGSSAEGASLKIYIFERTVDLVTPLVHDFHYESLLGDLLAGQVQIYNDRAVDPPKKDSKGELKRIEDEDKIYRMFRYSFIGDVLNGLPEHLKQFKKENPTAVAQQNKNEEMRLGQMQNMLRGINDYNDFMKYYSFNLDNVNKIMGISNKESLQPLADLEITVATAIDESGAKVDAKVRAEAVRKYLASGLSDQVKLRLALMALGSLKCDVSFLRDLLPANAKRVYDTFANKVNQFGLIYPEDLKETIRGLIKKRFNDNKASLQRYMSRVDYLVSRSVVENFNGEFERFSYGATSSKPMGPTGTTTNTLFNKKLALTKNVTASENTTIIVFFLGEVSYAEIGALMRLEKQQQPKVRVLVGGNSVCGPKEYLEGYLGYSE